MRRSRFEKDNAGGHPGKRFAKAAKDKYEDIPYCLFRRSMQWAADNKLDARLVTSGFGGDPNARGKRWREAGDENVTEDYGNMGVFPPKRLDLPGGAAGSHLLVLSAAPAVSVNM